MTNVMGTDREVLLVAHQQKLTCRKEGGTTGSKYQEKWYYSLLNSHWAAISQVKQLHWNFFYDKAYVHISRKTVYAFNLFSEGSWIQRRFKSLRPHQAGYRPPRPLPQTTLSHDTFLVSCVQQTSSHHCVTLDELLYLSVPKFLTCKWG